MTEANPLLQPWTTPFGIPPFDRIRPAHFEPALDAAAASHLAEIAAIAGDPAPPSFANTLEALQRSGRTLARVEAVFDNLVASLGGTALEAARRTLAPRLAEHRMRVALDPGVFARVSRLYHERGRLGLDEDQLRLLERTHLGAIRSGAALEPAAKQRLTEISSALAVLHTAFGQNVLHDETAWHLPLAAADLDGLPGFVRDGAAAAAAERGLDGHAITLSRSLIEPFLSFSNRRDLRRRAYEAWIARGTHPGAHDNRPLIPEILALRRERAELLGYRDFAAFRLADTMAGTPEAVHRLLHEVWQPAKAKAAAERDRLLAAARADGFNDAIEPWDWRFYAEKVRRADYALDEAELKPFFVFGAIQQAAFDTAARLFGVRFIPLPDAKLYHPDVRAYEVQDAQGHVGVFLADPYARPDKRSGAWMSSYRDQEAIDGPVSPVIVNNNNFARAEPTLLSFDDATTLFHELGHGLHGLLSRVRYPAQSGTNVRRDFVELPSQIFEHWMALPDTLRQYARHHASGEPLPEALIDRLLAARGFNQGFGTVSYAAAALMDLALHLHEAPAAIDVDAFEAATLAAIGMPAEIGIRHRPAHFQHLFDGGGYAAGYYSYLWAEVLDADGFEAFIEAGDPFDPALAAGLQAILAAGDTSDPMALYVAFRGREPDTGALLRRRQLTPA
jgi:peptidyl-dipeptidase Dcp